MYILESLTYSCFCHLMKRMVDNFPNGGAMDNHLANMRSLIRVIISPFLLLVQNSFKHVDIICHVILYMCFNTDSCNQRLFEILMRLYALSFPIYDCLDICVLSSLYCLYNLFRYWTLNSMTSCSMMATIHIFISATVGYFSTLKGVRNNISLCCD